MDAPVKWFKFSPDGLDRFRQGEIIETATRETTDVISVKQVNANSSEYALAA
jgi:hypothetical protein